MNTPLDLRFKVRLKNGIVNCTHNIYTLIVHISKYKNSWNKFGREATPYV